MGSLRVIFRRVHWRAALWVVIVVLMGGCSSPTTESLSVPVALTPVIVPTGTPTQGPSPGTPTVIPTATPVLTPTPVLVEDPLTVAVSGDLPEEMALPLMVALNQIDRVQAANALFPVQLLDQPDNADMVIDAVPWPVADAALAQRVFAVVAPFATVRDDISLDDLRLRWQGQGDGPVLAVGSTMQLLTPILGTAGGRARRRDRSAGGPGGNARRAGDCALRPTPSPLQDVDGGRGQCACQRLRPGGAMR